MESQTTDDRKLYAIFDQAFDMYYSFEKCNDPTNSPEFQANIKKCIGFFEECTNLVNIANLFSSNETFNEIPTNNVKYLLLPYFLGKLTQKLCGGSREEIVNVAEVYFKDFLKRLSEYSFTDENTQNANNSAPVIANDPMASLTQMVLQRNTKLEKYRQKKELEDKIIELRDFVRQDHVDDETKRDFYNKMLKFSVFESQEEITSIEQEKEILKFQNRFDEMKASEKPMSAKVRPRAPLKPIIITKDSAQKAVFGLGYPSLPVMTVSEFYDQRVQEGIFPDPKLSHASHATSKGPTIQGNDDDDDDDVEREQKLDKDDEYELARLRAKDEYKDEHRRGEGNRYNRS